MPQLPNITRAPHRWWTAATCGVRETSLAAALVLSPLLVGYAIGRRRERCATARRQMREREVWEERAAARERSRIARDMHDTLAHRVSGIVLTANVLLAASDSLPAASALAVERIRKEGHQILEELRDTLCLLASRAAAVHTPATHVDRIVALTDQLRSDGTTVCLKIDGHPEVLPDPIQLVAYRVVQESLTNTIRHATGADVSVLLQCEADGLRVEVSDTGARRTPDKTLPSGHHGLSGLAERVSLLGGTFSAQRCGEGFAVRAFLPLPACAEGRPGEHDAPPRRPAVREVPSNAPDTAETSPSLGR
ncbi:sensor histidine kinase (plasmid) [Streptomyces sp. QH1-20]|uniref:sensor histidine kinase n=1 Tax=Streptomyces sp. QH1-20 TaxID=3240934 RepID=UPI003513CB15